MSRKAQPHALPGRDDLARLLVELGLTLTEARTYTTLLRLGGGPAADIAQAAGVPRPKVYEALRALERRGFCSGVGEQRVAEYRPIAAEVALPRWMRQREHDRRLAAEHDERIAERLLRELPQAQMPDEDATTYMETITGPARTSETLERLIGAAARSLHMMQQPPFLQPRSRWNVAEIEACRRGVDVRVLYAAPAVQDEARFRPLLEAGGQVRVCTAVPMKLLVRDGVEAMLSLRDPSTGQQGLTSAVIHHPDLVGPLQLLFHREWKGGRRVQLGGTREVTIEKERDG